MTGMLSAEALARALTLRERLALLTHPPSREPAASKQLDVWRAREPFQDPAWWRARLRADGIDEKTLRHIVAGPFGRTAARLPQPPDWAVELATAYERHGDADPLAVGAGTTEDTHFVPLVAPLLAHARARLARQLDELAWPATLEPSRLLDELFRPLPQLLNRMVNRTMAREVNAARIAGHLAGATAEERFASFVADLARPATRSRVFDRYPVLGRQLAVAVAAWVSAGAELALRLHDDCRALTDLLGPGTDHGRLVTVVTHLGDRHRGGRTVARLSWESGAQVMYKPRSVQIDVRFQRLLGWLNEHGVSYPFRQLAYVERPGYGWMEFVRLAPCPDEAALRRFYHRQGGLLAVLHVLRANDFHAENLVAAGEQPVLVDLESLAQPNLPLDDPTATPAEQRALEITLGSVLRIGLLPSRIWNTDGRTVDISGLGAVPGQRSPLGMPVLTGAGTDTVRVTLERQLLDMPHHRPVPESEQLRLLDYADDLVAGFTETYEILRMHRAALLAEGGPLHAFGPAEVRVIPRGTLLYATIRQTGFHPDLLGDALQREMHLDCLWRPVPRQPGLAALVAAERRDLWANDIPLFTTRVDGSELYDSTGEAVPGMTVQPGLSRIREAVDALGPADLARQQWLIRGALGTTVIDASRELTIIGYAIDRRAGPPDQERLVRAASMIGDQLARVAVDAPCSAQWLGVSSDRGRNWNLGPLGPDLFNGLAGVALFLAMLGATTGEAGHTDLARRALATVERQLDRGLETGGMAGLGGVIWAVCHLGRLWRDERLLDLAQRQAARLADLIGADVEYDVVAGAAGSILALRALHLVRPDGLAHDVIRRCADHLVATARPFPPDGVGWVSESVADSGLATVPMAGFAHGQAGVALALLEAAALTGDERYRATARAALAYERTLFDPAAGNWRDVRVAQPGAEDLPLVAWCHGAPGIGLARVLSHRHLPDDPQLIGEIEVALATTRAQGFGASHCQCHGDLGNVELFTHAAEALARPRLREEATVLVGGLMAGIEQGAWRCGVPLAVQTPSMLVGLAGIGYGLLRMAHPDRVPAVLTLDPGTA